MDQQRRTLFRSPKRQAVGSNPPGVHFLYQKRHRHRIRGNIEQPANRPPVALAGCKHFWVFFPGALADFPDHHQQKDSCHMSTADDCSP